EHQPGATARQPDVLQVGDGQVDAVKAAMAARAVTQPAPPPVASAPLLSPATPRQGAWARFLAGDLWYSFRTSPVAITAALIAFICVFCAVFAHWVAPHNPFDLATLELGDSRLPPVW